MNQGPDRKTSRQKGEKKHGFIESAKNKGGRFWEKKKKAVEESFP